ncbi:MAG: DUF1961 family protein [Candidatus Brocadiia bacterium]
MLIQAETIVPDESVEQPGPWTGVEAFSTNQPTEVELDTPLGAQGTVMAWVHVDQPIVNGPEVSGEGERLLELPELGDWNIWWYRGYGGVSWVAEDGPNLVAEVPGLPGPQWFHVCYTWDADRGLAQGYINGTPTKLSPETSGPWQTKSAETVKVDASRWFLGGIRTTNRYISHEEALSAVPSVYRGAIDHTLGAQDLGQLDPDRWRGETVFEVPLTSADDVESWQLEGPGTISFEDEWMRMRSLTPDADGKEGHIVHWCDRDVPADFLAEWDCRILSESGLNIVFFCARGRNGEDVLDPALDERTGIFGHYTGGDIDCYHISYYANAPGGGGRTTSNMRKNHGFYLVDNGPIGIPPDDHEVHHVSLLKKGGLVRLGVDGRCVIDWYDDGQQYGPVLGKGKIGLRQMKWTVGEYRNLRVSRVKTD